MRRLTNFIGGRSVALSSGEYVELINSATGEVIEQMLHGGLRRSGYGKDHSVYGFENYARTMHVTHSVES